MTVHEVCREKRESKVNEVTKEIREIEEIPDHLVLVDKLAFLDLQDLKAQG